MRWLLLIAALGVEQGGQNEYFPGHVTHNAAYSYDDIRVPLSSVKRIGNSDPDWENFGDGLYALAFDAATDQEVVFAMQLPHSYSEGTDLDLHVHWMPSSTNTGDVRWCIEWTWTNINATTGGSTTNCALDAGDGTALKHQYADIVDMTGTGKTISSMIMARLYRDANHADDDYNADAYLLEVDAHFQQDSIGSSTETAK